MINKTAKSLNQFSSIHTGWEGGEGTHWENSNPIFQQGFEKSLRAARACHAHRGTEQVAFRKGTTRTGELTISYLASHHPPNLRAHESRSDTVQ